MKTITKRISVLLGIAMFIMILFVAISATSGVALADDTEDENVYLVWKESNFQKNTDYVLTDSNDDGEYTYTFAVTADTRLLSYYVDYKGTQYYPNTDGAVELEEGSYKIYFNPSLAYSTEFGLQNTKVEEIRRYYLMCPENDYLQNESYALTLDEDNTDFDEYLISISFSEPKTYSFYVRDVVDEMDYYSNEEHFTEITEEGNYTISFAPMLPYDTGYNVKIAKTIEEIYYLMYSGNNFVMNTTFEMTLDEDRNNPFDEYIYELSFADETDFVYYVYASKAKVMYYPNSDGFVTIDDEGDYDIVFSPEHAYFTDANETLFYTTVELSEDYFPETDFYFLSAKNGYEICDDNKLTLNDKNTRFDEYITTTISFDAPTDYVYYIYAQEVGESTGINYYPNDTGVFEIKSAGSYVVKFSQVHAYSSQDDVSYYTTIDKVNENPIYYLMCIDNDFKMNDDFVLEFNDENDEYDEYICDFETYETGTSFAYYVYDSINDKRYYPNKTGVVYLEQIDVYTARFSLVNSYDSDDSDDDENNGEYYTCIELKERDFGGYYILGNLNDYRFLSDTEFAEKYMLASVPANNAQEGYDYYIELDVTADMIDEHEKIKYFITDGIDRYRSVDGKNFVITESGKYAIYFAEPSDKSTAAVYHYALKKYNSIEAVSELMLIDKDDNNVYVAAEDLTSDMEAKVITRGKYSYIEITRDGELIKLDKLRITYYVGSDVKNYEVKTYSNKVLNSIETKYLTNHVVFNCRGDDGFIIEKTDNGLSPTIISFIVSAVVIVLSNIVFVSIIIARKKKKTAKQDEAQI